jgi:hypothetical protein
LSGVREIVYAVDQGTSQEFLVETESNFQMFWSSHSTLKYTTLVTTAVLADIP